MISRSEKNKQLENKLKKEEITVKHNKIIKLFIKSFSIFIIFFILLLTYMYFIGTKGLIVREYKITDNIPDSFNGFKIVHFSDLHYLSTINKKELKNIVNSINELKPDIVVFTGDLIDENKNITDDDINTLSKYLNKIKVTTDLFAIKGNHDYNNDYFEKVINKTKFKVLNNDYQLIYFKGNIPILLTGTNSKIKNDCDFDKAFSFNEMDNLYTISLIHEPDISKDIANKYSPNLILAGHSHNGQIRLPIFGAILTVDQAKIFPNEKYTINNTKLYVSGGLGTSKFKFRLFNHPSINLYRLNKGA